MSDMTPPERLWKVSALAALLAERWPKGDLDIQGAYEALGWAEDNLTDIELVITDGYGLNITVAAAGGSALNNARHALTAAREALGGTGNDDDAPFAGHVEDLDGILEQVKFLLDHLPSSTS